MKRMKAMKLIIVTGFLVFACSKKDSTNKSDLETKPESNTEQKENVNTMGQDSPKKDSTMTKSVKNETEFDVPLQFVEQTGITSEPLTRSDDGKIQIPNASVQDFNGNSSVFISLGDNKFALRFINIIEKNDSHSLTDANVLEAEMVVTVGAPLLKNGLLRMQSGHTGHSDHRGHSHH